MGDRGGTEVFTTFSDNGWPNDPTACLVGLNAAIIILIGGDSQAHLAEETMDAGRIVPRLVAAVCDRCVEQLSDFSIIRAMVTTAPINYAIGFVTIVVSRNVCASGTHRTLLIEPVLQTVLCVLGPDVEAIRATPTGVPVVEVLLRSTGNVLVTTVLTCLLGLLFVCCLTNNVTTGSRQLWYGRSSTIALGVLR